MSELQKQLSVVITPAAELTNPHYQLNRTNWAVKASQLLKQLGGEHTFQPPPENLEFALSIGHASVATSEHGDLAGFVKMAPWVIDKNQHASMAETPEEFENIHTDETRPVCVEIGSLVVDAAHQGKNIGKALVNQMLSESNLVYPQLPKIAVVTNDNGASLAVFNKLGWSTLSKEQAASLLGIDVLDGWEPPSTIFISPDPQL